MHGMIQVRRRGAVLAYSGLPRIVALSLRAAVPRTKQQES